MKHTNAMHDDLPVIAIVGRPNVGKSALFNRIVGRRISIVHEQAGVTRDRIAAPVSVAGRHFLLVDTGGLGMLPKQKTDDLFDGLIRTQVHAVVADATALIWVVDAQDGLTDLDRELAEFLRQTELPVVLVANKADNEELRAEVPAEFAALGFGTPLSTSVTHSFGVQTVVGQVLQTFPIVEMEEREKPEPPFRLAVLGRPNVGKSSLINALLAEDRVMVSHVAGTTRDAVDIPFRLDWRDEEVPMTLIDTAGLRKRGRLDSAVEYFSILRTENAIRRCDATVLLLDCEEPGTGQDRRIARLICEARKPCVLVCNKWDLVRDRGMRERELIKLVRSMMPFVAYAPVVTTSATEGFHLEELLERVMAVRAQREVHVPTAVLNQFLHDVVQRTPPPSVDGKFLKFFYATMRSGTPPHFVLFVNHTRRCPRNYEQFLENQLRAAFFAGAGVPLRLDFRERRQPQGRSEGERQAVAGIMRRKVQEKRDIERRKGRRKGYRK